jgi:hypothetical protein
MQNQENTYNSEDQQRDAAVYLYLLTKLTDLGISEGSPKPNEYKITKQWGQNRMFVRRVLRSVMPDLYEDKDREDRIPGLTLGKLVDILTSLQDYCKNESEKNAANHTPRIISQYHKERVLQKYSQLCPTEKEKLDIFIHPQASLLEQLQDIITDKIQGLPEITHFYKQALSLYTSLKQELGESDGDRLESRIENYTRKIIEHYYTGLNSDLKEEKIKRLVSKILVELSRNELQAGIRQVRSTISEYPSFVQENLKTDFISNKLLESLVDSVVKNDLLADEFPIYIDYVEIEKVDPLPLKRYDSNSGLINPDFLKPENKQKHYAIGLEKQTAIRVRVHFYIHISKKEDDPKPRLDFCEEVTGIGSPISHITRAINRFLFEDIPILKKNGYLPIAQKILSEDRIIGNTRNSVVFSYSVVKLCKQKNIEQALQTQKNYDDIAVDQELALGKYYGFDLLEAATKSALYARLRAIQQSEVKSSDYLKELCHRIEEKEMIKKAEGFLDFYPFSLRAMQDYLNEKLFHKKYRQWDVKKLKFEDVTPNDESWSLVAYKAHLKILQAYFQEGLYSIGKKYIDIIQPHVKDGRLDDKLLLSLYNLCLFRHHFYTDLEDKNSEHVQRSGAIRKAEECLSNAENILKDYLKDHAVIGEYSTANAYPFFYYLSRVYADRAKLYIFFPYSATPPDSKNHLLIEPISLLEEARIYAARDGNTHHYSYWTVYQTWCYLIAAYLGDSQQIGTQFSRENCIQWSRRLIENAIDCYAERGKKSYLQIRHNSGKQNTETHRTEPELSGDRTWFYEEYGSIFVQTIPPIIEIGEGSTNLDSFYRKLLEDSESKTRLLELPMSALTYKSSGNTTYFFGVYSSILLFGLGMVELGEDKGEEELKTNIEMAMRRLTLCAAIASEGTEYIEDEGKFYLQRQFVDQDETMPKDYTIRGLYLHRLTHFAALGKIFAAACRVILWLHDPTKEEYWPETDYLLRDLHDIEIIKKSQNPEHSKGQTRYNGHLDQQFKKVKDYLEQYQENPLNLPSLTAIRNKILTDVFKILREEKPSTK